MNVEVRTCCGCGKTHPLTTEFFRSAKRHGVVGYTYKCKKCFRQEYEANKPKVIAYGRARYEANKEKIRERRKWANLPPEKVAKLKEQHRARYWKNPEKRRADSKKWRKENPEKVLQSRIDHYDSEKQKARRKHNVENLTDVYIRETLVKRGSRQIDIPQELIELKRIHLKLQRAIKSEKVKQDDTSESSQR